MAELDLHRYQGSAHFGPGYHYLYEHDSHAPGSVDRALLEEMLLVCAETETYLYTAFTPLEPHYRKGSRPALEACVQKATEGCLSAEERIAAIARFTAGLGEYASDDMDLMRLGGTEEAIIDRGSDWCTDLARVGCVLFQIAGLPARIVMLADTAQAYSGHVITEAHRNGVWGAVDTTTGKVYVDADGCPVSAAAIRRTGQQGQFRCVAVANYFVWEAAKYTYTVSGINDYYRSILTKAQQGWPGGLRWLHGEEACR